MTFLIQKKNPVVGELRKWVGVDFDDVRCAGSLDHMLTSVLMAMDKIVHGSRMVHVLARTDEYRGLFDLLKINM